MPDEETQETDDRLHGQEAQREFIFAHGTPPDEPEIDQREIGRFDDGPVCVGDNVQEMKTLEELEKRREERRGGRRRA